MRQYINYNVFSAVVKFSAIVAILIMLFVPLPRSYKLFFCIEKHGNFLGYLHLLAIIKQSYE